jgi:hypothetical protein
VSGLIKKNREDEYRHVTWIRDAVRTRPWLQEGAGASAAEGSEIQA